MAQKFATIKCPRCNGRGTLPDVLDVGRKMKARREKAGLTPQELASRMGVDRSLISKKEAGNRGWTPEFQRRYLQALKQ